MRRVLKSLESFWTYIDIHLPNTSFSRFTHACNRSGLSLSPKQIDEAEYIFWFYSGLHQFHNNYYELWWRAVSQSVTSWVALQKWEQEWNWEWERESRFTFVEKCRGRSTSRPPAQAVETWRPPSPLIMRKAPFVSS